YYSDTILFLLMLPRPPTSTLFPYTTLFRSSPKVSVLGLVANGWDQDIDNNSGKTGGFRLQVFPSPGLAVAGGVLYGPEQDATNRDRKSTRLNSSHLGISYAVFCLKKKKKKK